MNLRLPSIIHWFLLLNLLIGLSACEPNQPSKAIDQVNPFIGTGGHGHTYPGATYPFGQIQVSPNNGRNGWDWCSGYHYSDSLLAGFTHLHLSGTGIGDLCDIAILPGLKSIPYGTTGKNRELVPQLYTTYKHENEQAEPGFYRVKLDNQVDVELTATQRMGAYRIHFPQASSKIVLLDLGFAINWDKTTDAYLQVEQMNTLTGYRFSTGWAEDQKVYFAIRFSYPFSNWTAKSNEEWFLNSPDGIQSDDLLAFFHFNEDIDSLKIKVGISAASIEGALAAIDQTGGWNFNQWKSSTQATWESHLGVIEARSDNNDILSNFYTALYHAQVAPNLHSDWLNEYGFHEGEFLRSDSFDFYSTFSLWDTYRALHPLLTIIQPERSNHFIQSFLAHYEQHGKLPVWALFNNETNCMIGNHSIPVIVDAYRKGIRDYDTQKVYDAMKHSLMTNDFGLDHLKKYGYIPYNLENESVSKTLEYAFDDWCMAQMAQWMGKDEDYHYFLNRSQAYQQLFDSETGFMRGKDSLGIWKPDFNPLFANHRDDEYTEGNAWQYTWYVPHAIDSLIALMGGKDAFVDKLDQLFDQKTKVEGEHASPDISGLIGQYAHGNEPSHHVAYLYNYAGRPDKTQERVRQILNELYAPTPDGLCGNEDCGQLSAWYVFSAMGFYPVNPASGIYQIGSPILDSYRIHLPNEKQFAVSTESTGEQAIYVKEVWLNDQLLDRWWITHEEIVSGGSLKFVMSAEPPK